MSDLGSITAPVPGQGAGSGAARGGAQATGMSAFLALLDALLAGDGALQESDQPAFGTVGHFPPGESAREDGPETPPPDQLSARLVDEEGEDVPDEAVDIRETTDRPETDATPEVALLASGIAPAGGNPQAVAAAASVAHEAPTLFRPAGGSTQPSDGPPAGRDLPPARTLETGERDARPPPKGQMLGQLGRSMPAASVLASVRDGQGPAAAPRAELVSTALAAMQELDGDIAGQPRLTMPMQPTALPAAEAALPSAAGRIAAAAVATEIVAQARGGNRHFDIRLEPPELGRIEVRLDFRQDGSMAAKLLVDRPETLDLLMRDARGLEKALQAGGLKLEDGAVHYQLRDQAAFARGDATSDQTAGGDADDPEEAGQEEVGLPPPWRAVARGGIDIRV